MHEATWTREEAIARLDDPERRVREDPRKLWRLAGLARGMWVVEVGAGTGYYSFPASEIVGPAGRVYAVDVSADLVALMRERARHRGRTNFESVRSRPGRVPLPAGIADRVLLANLLHGVPSSTVREAVRLLRRGGMLIDVDWKKSGTSWGPPVAHRLSPTAARRALEQYGLRTVGGGEFGPSHYFLLLEKDGTARHPKTKPRTTLRGEPAPAVRGASSS